MTEPTLAKYQPYTPRPRWTGGVGGFAPDATDGAEWDVAARAYSDVAPGEVEALLRVERSA
ncbi:hypothetical protein [Brevundimonas sp. BAL3]|uniref:hypothetical protein n=1 Tax=Brevundimonas sp. BAL3 TaxID=391600 RepID=UPI00017EBAE8|nr:hypothetical protein [Brevundimonas sp. BAL3]EDX79225.1 hypothetical protein BBAL3_382 [Brevundimonas sp. BAL3]